MWYNTYTEILWCCTKCAVYLWCSRVVVLYKLYRIVMMWYNTYTEILWCCAKCAEYFYGVVGLWCCTRCTEYSWCGRVTGGGLLCPKSDRSEVGKLVTPLPLSTRWARWWSWSRWWWCAWWWFWSRWWLFAWSRACTRWSRPERLPLGSLGLQSPSLAWYLGTQQFPIQLSSGQAEFAHNFSVLVAWLSLNFILWTSWVALYSVVCQGSVTPTKSPLFQCIQAQKPFTESRTVYKC